MELRATIRRVRGRAGPLYDSRFNGAIAVTLAGGLMDAVARSLVECDAPLRPGEFTGSKYCGDRAVVIAMGQRITSLLATLMSLAFAVAAVPLGILVDRLDRRKIVMVTAASGMARLLSAALATSPLVSPASGIMLVYIATLTSAVTPTAEEALWMDLADGDEVRRSEMWYIRNLSDIIAAGTAALISVQMLRSEVINFWMVFLCLSVLPLLQLYHLSQLQVPSTSREEGKNGADRKPALEEAKDMLREAVELSAEPVVRWGLLQTVVLGVARASIGFVNPFLMSTFGWPQHNLPGIIYFMGYASIPLMMLGVKLRRRFGCRTVAWANFHIQTLCVPMRLLYPVTPLAPLLVHCCSLSSHLVATIEPSLHAKLPQGQSKMRGRSAATVTVLSALADAMGTMILRWAFSPEASGYWLAALPWIITAVAEAFSSWIYAFKLWPVFGPILDEVTREQQEQEAVKLSEKKD